MIKDIIEEYSVPGRLHSVFRNVISHYRSRAMNSIMVNGRVTAEFG